MARRGSGFLDAAEQILRERGEPMRGEEIVHIGLERRLFTTMTRDEVAAQRSLIGSLYSDIRRGGNRRGFVHYGNSLFGLAEWDSTQQIPIDAKPRRTRQPAQPTTPIPPGITLEMLEQTRQLLPEEQFRRIFGAIYDRLLAEERSRAITPVSDRFLAEKARPVVQRVQDFLQGRGTESPKSEMVCDWIFICYNLELYREGAALWRYVNQDEVNPWQYERTAKFSAACRVRAGL